VSARRAAKQNFNALKRRTPVVRPSGQSILIVTEGTKTEPLYFIALRKHLRLTTAEVTIVHPEGTDPLTLVDEAINRLEERSRLAKKSDAIVPYDEVWVVFDLESPHNVRRDQARAAKERGLERGIKFAPSDPAFEFWLLLHETYTTRPFADCDEVIRQLKAYYPGFTKTQTPDAALLAKLPNAVVHAERCRKHHADSAGDGNPSTDVDLLVRNLNEATREANRFKFPENLYLPAS
jgi:hypothetical protein